MGPARPATHDPEEDVLSIVLAAQHDQHNDGSLTSFEEVTLLAVLVSADDPDQDGTEPVTIIIGDPAGGADGDLPSPAPDSEAACSAIVQSFITPDADVVITNTTLSVPLPASDHEVLLMSLGDAEGCLLTGAVDGGASSSHPASAFPSLFSAGVSFHAVVSGYDGSGNETSIPLVLTDPSYDNATETLSFSSSIVFGDEEGGGGRRSLLQWGVISRDDAISAESGDVDYYSYSVERPTIGLTVVPRDAVLP